MSGAERVVILPVSPCERDAASVAGCPCRPRRAPAGHIREANGSTATLTPLSPGQQRIGLLFAQCAGPECPAAARPCRSTFVPVIGNGNHGVEIEAAVHALARLNVTRSATTSDLAPAPTGPAATLASAPALTEFANSELSAFSVMTSVTFSETEMPAWKPTLAVAIVKNAGPDHLPVAPSRASRTARPPEPPNINWPWRSTERSGPLARPMPACSQLMSGSRRKLDSVVFSPH